jgi:hypothetical protein
VCNRVCVCVCVRALKCDYARLCTRPCFENPRWQLQVKRLSLSLSVEPLIENFDSDERSCHRREGGQKEEAKKRGDAGGGRER